MCSDQGSNKPDFEPAWLWAQELCPSFWWGRSPCGLEETLEEDDLEDLPDSAKPLKDKNHVVAKRNPKRANVIHEESRSKRIRRVPAKYLQWAICSVWQYLNYFYHCDFLNKIIPCAFDNFWFFLPRSNLVIHQIHIQARGQGMYQSPVQTLLCALALLGQGLLVLKRLGEGGRGGDFPPSSKHRVNGWKVPKLSWNLVSYRD